MSRSRVLSSTAHFMHLLKTKGLVIFILISVATYNTLSRRYHTYALLHSYHSPYCTLSHVFIFKVFSVHTR